MVQTYKELQDKVLRQLDEAGDTDTTLALVKDGLNTANRRRVTGRKWTFMLWDTPETLNIVAGTKNYGLHPEFFWPFYFYNVTEDDVMTQIDEDTLIQSGVDFIDGESGALRFALWGRTPVQNQPASASVLQLTSSNAADNGSKTVVVRGDTADGVTSETITCGSSGSVQFTKILKVTKIGTWQGTLTLTAGSVTVLKLFAAEAGRSYQQLFLPLEPTEAQTAQYRFYRQPQVMTLDADLPDVPPPFEDILVYDTLLDFAAYNNYDSGIVQIWTRKRDDLLTDMLEAYDQAKAIEAMPHYTEYIPR